MSAPMLVAGLVVLLAALAVFVWAVLKLRSLPPIERPSTRAAAPPPEPPSEPTPVPRPERRDPRLAAPAAPPQMPSAPEPVAARPEVVSAPAESPAPPQAPVEMPSPAEALPQEALPAEAPEPEALPEVPSPFEGELGALLEPETGATEEPVAISEPLAEPTEMSEEPPTLPHAVAPAPAPASQRQVDIRMVAPVQLRFSDSPRPVGVRASSSTHASFKQAADALFEELARARREDLKVSSSRPDEPE